MAKNARIHDSTYETCETSCDQGVRAEKIGITCEVLVRFPSFFENKWSFPPDALEHPFGPICSLALDGSAHLLFSLIREIGHCKLWPFESTPGHPTFSKILPEYCEKEA